jgi:hypothetical protein
MVEPDRKRFYELMADVYAFYRADTSTFTLEVWWEAMKPFDFDAVHAALRAHAMSADTGQFLPKPADVVRLLQGGTQDRAMLAWSKVDAAVRGVGTYRDVVFDDPLIHAVLHDMGGWLPMGEKGEDEWPFIAKEFATRYRGYAIRLDRPAYPPVLIGIAGAHNRKESKDTEPPVLLGDPDRALAVMQGGIDRPRLQVTPMIGAMKVLEEQVS